MMCRRNFIDEKLINSECSECSEYSENYENSEHSDKSLKTSKKMNENRKQKTLNILTWINEIIHVITALFKRKHTV